MQHQSTTIIAKPSLGTRIFLLAGTLVPLGIGIFSIGKPIENYPEWLSPWVFHLGTIGLGLILMAKYISLETYVLNRNDMEVSAMFGFSQRTIPRSQVLSMVEVEERNEDTIWKKCTLYTNYGKFIISEQEYSNYADLMLVFRDQWQIKEDKPLLSRELKQNNLKQGIVSLAVAALIFYALQQIKAVYELAPRSELIEIKSRLVNDISLTDIGPDDNSVSLLLATYPGFNFKMDSYAKSVITRSDFEQIVVKNDTIILTVSKRDYQKKLEKTEPLNLWEKYINYPNITIYGLRNNAVIILNPDDFISATTGLGSSSNWTNGSIFYVLIFIFTMNGIQNLYDYIKGIL